MARPYPKIENSQAPPVIEEFDMGDLLDKISAEYNDEMQVPDNSFTVNAFAEKLDISRGKAQYMLMQMLKNGELQRKKIGIEHYYYE